MALSELKKLLRLLLNQVIQMVSENYLKKIRISVRRSASEAVNIEITDIIEECRADLQSVGVLKENTENENDPLILGAVRCFARWKFGLNNADATVNRDDYFQLRDELRKRRDYCISVT